MLALIFSWLGLSVLTIALGMGAVAALMLGFRTVAIVLAIVLAANLYSGLIYQQGVFEERAIWEQREADARRAEQKAKDDAEALRVQLAAARATVFALTKERQDANDARIIAEEAAEQARLEAESAQGGVCPTRRCVDSDADVRGLYDILR